MALYRPKQSIVTFAVLLTFQRYYIFCAVSTHFSIPNPIPTEIFGCSPWTRLILLEAAEAKSPSITITSWGYLYSNLLRDHNTSTFDRHTDRQTDNLLWQYRVLRVWHRAVKI